MSRREDGAAVVIGVGLMALLVLASVVSSGAVAMLVSHRQVQSAADLAALAGATAASAGQPACAAAFRIAARNGGVVAVCQVDGATVTAVVERELTGLLSGRVVRARARAGPVG